jgi:NitT/TauT family transport system substrate-binding protein
MVAQIKRRKAPMIDLRVDRRNLLRVATAALGASWLTPTLVRAAPEKTRIVLAVGGKSALYYLALTVAEQLGYFKDEGLDVEINDFAGGSKSVQALIGGSVDVVAGAYEHTIRMQMLGQQVQAFALIGRGMQLAVGVVTKYADKVKSGKDVKGMRFGVSAPGSSTHMLLNYWIAKDGLKPSDVVVIGVGAGASVMAAVSSGQIDGVAQSDPALTLLERKDAIRIVVDTRTMKGNLDTFGGPMPAATLNTKLDFIKRNPGTVQALANAIVRADKWLQHAAPEEVAKIVPPAYLLGDQALYIAALKSVHEVLSPDGLMPEDGPGTCLKFLAASDENIKPDKIVLEQTWTNEFAKRANEKYK